MKLAVVAILTFIFLTAAGFQSQRQKIAALTCTVKSDKTTYKVGELPELSVEIINNGSEDIYLLGSLDGSDVKWRMPYCYFTIQKPMPDTVHLSRCGNMNALSPKDFRLVKAGAKFNPYELRGDYGFFSDFSTRNPETFKNAGVYRVQFHYSTNSRNINDFMGDRPFQQNKMKAQKLVSLLKQVPKVDIVSNEIELTFVN